MKESKEKIKARMIRNASRIWGYTDTESEASFDPLVGLLMGALAGEIEMVSEEIHNTESRVVEKLVQLVTPEPVTGPLPAHAILRANPVQPVFEIYPEYQLYLYKKFKSPADPSKAEDKAVFFTPSVKTKLFNGAVRYMVSGSRWFEVDEEGYKDLVAEAPRGKGLPLSGFWLAVEVGEDVESLNGLRLYFELSHEQFSGAFYSTLPLSEWKINGVPVDIAGGYGGETMRAGAGVEEFIDREVDVTAKVLKHVNNFYAHHFITLDTGSRKPDEFPAAGAIPAPLADSFNPRLADHQTLGRLLWIEVNMKQPFSQEAIEDLHCTLNCFPVLNRQLLDFTISSRENLNIIPLETEDLFLDMKEVSNSSGKVYTMKSFSGLSDLEKGMYILRQGGMGRFDARNASEMIQYLVELLRDESAAFSVLGTDMISSSLRELNQSIARLEQRLQDTSLVRSNLSYIILKALPQDEIVFVEFWSTKASLANTIKSGNKLMAFRGADLVHDSITLVTTTAGGREKMDTNDRVNAYRRSLLSRGRVVTAEDIRALCIGHFGNALEKAEVRKGVMTGDTVNKGFIRTIDIILKLQAKTSQLPQEELDHLVKDLKVILSEQSSNVLPFRIMIE